MHLFLALALVTQTHQVPAYWGDLTPGPHQVGFTQRWVVDSTRRLPGGDSLGLRYRPILMNIWFPSARSTAVRMRYQDYLDQPQRLPGMSLGLRHYAAALRSYEIGVIARELLSAEADSLSPDQSRQLARLRSMPTRVQRDAPMRRGRFPVVFYVQGAQSSYDDNVVLCEFLASHGIIVVGSVYPAEDNSTLATSASDHSRQRDIRRLLLEVARLPGIEAASVTVVGHSAGGQAMLLFAADPSAPIDAVLTLDTTQDYARLSDRTWAYFTDVVLKARDRIRLPVMLVAGPGALFELGDSLRGSPRWLTTAPGLDHNEFISQGLLRRILNPDGGDSAGTMLVRRSYASLAWLIRDWVTDLGLSPAPALVTRVPLTLEQVPVGTTAPGIQGGPILDARTLRHLYSTASDHEFVTAALKARRAGASGGENSVLGMLFAGGILAGDSGSARRRFGLLAAGDSTVQGVVNEMVSRARLLERYHLDDLAAEWWRLARALDPEAGQQPAGP